MIPFFKTIRMLLSRQWWWATLLAVLGVGVLIRLGFWQLDRLEQRRAFNIHLQEQFDSPVLNLNASSPSSALIEMEYRAVEVVGVYDFDHEIAVRNQAWNGRPGYVLVTPLIISGTQTAVLVNRGWIPLEDFSPGEWQVYQQIGTVDIAGLIRLSREKPDFGAAPEPTPVPGEDRQVWNFINIDLISRQVPYELLPVYVQRGPESDFPKDINLWTIDHLPFPSLPELEITEGPHLGYAVQWFIFAAILGFGYPILVYRESLKDETPDPQ